MTTSRRRGGYFSSPESRTADAGSPRRSGPRRLAFGRSPCATTRRSADATDGPPGSASAKRAGTSGSGRGTVESSYIASLEAYSQSELDLSATDLGSALVLWGSRVWGNGAIENLIVYQSDARAVSADGFMNFLYLDDATASISGNVAGAVSIGFSDLRLNESTMVWASLGGFTRASINGGSADLLACSSTAQVVCDETQIATNLGCDACAPTAAAPPSVSSDGAVSGPGSAPIPEEIAELVDRLRGVSGAEEVRAIVAEWVGM